MSDVTIRLLTEKDIDTFFDLFTSLLKTEFPEYSPRAKEYMLTSSRMCNKDNFSYILKNNTRFIFGAFVNNELVGILEAEYPFGGVSLGVWLMIKKSLQKQGIGAALVRMWENKTKEVGGHNLYVYTDKRNKGFYEKVGFKLVGLHEKSWFGNDEYIFSKVIQNPVEENFLK